MAASTANNTTRTNLVLGTVPIPVAASTNIYANCYVCTDASGNLNLAADTAGFVFAGIVGQQFNNATGAAGVVTANVFPPCISPENRFAEMACTGASQAWVGVLMYFLDDNTVAQAGSTSHSILMGKCVWYISATQVVVDMLQRV
jgi:hypothetical protein